jgi:hypothetical protein
MQRTLFARRPELRDKYGFFMSAAMAVAATGEQVGVSQPVSQWLISLYVGVP